jgi:GWxTD domain-containing protein
MSDKRLIRNLALAASIVISSVSFGIAQKTEKTPPNEDPTQKDRKVKTEESKKKIYQDWVSKDVAYIITSDEVKAYKKLTTDEERENFIENFWRRRDPDPDTEENEYREEYFERIAYANEKYASGIPGWKTDRGRIYITFGKPDSVESHPSGGSYDRPSYEGGGSTTTYPFETWFYRHLDNVGDGIEIEFVDPTGTGEYRIARNADEKDALLQIPGAGLTLNEQLGLGDKGDRISGNNGQNNNYQRAQDSPFARLELITNLQRPPQVKFADLEKLAGEVPGLINADNSIDFDLRVDFFRQSEDRVVATFTVQADNKELVFENFGGLPTARMNVFGKVTAVSGKRSGVFEDSVSTSSTPDELAQVKDRKSVYQKAIALQPGTYKVNVSIRDVSTGKTGLRSLGFTVPRYETEKLSTSTLILATRLYQTTEKDIGGQFIIGDKKVIPNVSGNYKKGQEVGIYMQVYNAGIDQTTLRPSVDVEYILMKDGKQILTQKEDWNGLSDSGQRLTLARLLPTAGMSPGDYELKIKIRDLVPNTKGEIQALEPSAKFTITQ